MFRVPFRAALVAVLLALGAASAGAPVARAQSPGPPILVVTNAGATFSGYYAEILRAEGMNEFAVADAGALNPSTLGAYQVVVLAATGLSDGQALALGGWVQSGGNLIAMKPEPKLAGLLGLGTNSGALADGYLKVEPGGPGAGITGETMQFHGSADLWSLAGATPVATLYANATSATSSPAVTLRSVGGAGGQAAAFTYDLAQSVVETRQGNPAWAGTERDGISPVRSDDLFFGGAQPDWVDLAKVHIPQADEQQRLLANLITQMNLDRAPLPRFWYLPRGLPAAVVMTGDDHATGGTSGQFNGFEGASPAGCSVADWQCVRSTSYVYPDTPVPGAAAYLNQGFEIALHLNTGCGNRSDNELRSFWSAQLPPFRSAFGISSIRTNRTHCIAWSGWVNDAIVEREQGIRLDTNYYYWPGSWALPHPGMFTGSGFPMRFADLNGSLVDVYQAATQLTDEWGDSQVQALGVSTHINALLDRAVGPEGYYGVFTANMHTDNSSHPGANAIVAAAQARGVPVVSAAQMLDWLDGRNGSSFQGMSYAGGRLSFSIARADGSRGLQAMLPAAGPLLALTRDGAPVGATPIRIKGIHYLMFDATAGNYVATFAVPATGGVLGATGGTPDRTAPKVVVSTRTRRVRASRKGVVKLRVSCPRGELFCRLDIRLRRKGHDLAHKKLTVRGGKTGTAKLRLNKSARALLARKGSLKVKAVIRASDARSNHHTTTTRILLLAPGRR